MKRFVSIVCLSILLVMPIGAQLVVTSFRYSQFDATANTSTTERYDQNGERCALIKVETTQKGFHFDVGTLGVTYSEEQNAQHPSEIWVYVPHHVKHITIQHPQLGTLRDYMFPETIKSSCTYILQLGTGTVETIVHEAIQSQYLLFKVTPIDAIVDVTYNGEESAWPVLNGETSRLVPFGRYQYRVSADGYHTEAGAVEVKDLDNTHIVTVSLKPNFGWLKIATSADLQDAQVYVDNKLCGTIPFESNRIFSGEHTLRIIKPMYKSYAQQFTITDNQTLTLTPQLIANFAELTLKVGKNAEIWVNNKKYGEGQWSGNLEVGEYVIETKLAAHRPISKTYKVTSEMRHQTITLSDPIPIYGTLQIESRPSGATVIIDGKVVGETPKLVRNILIGDHTIELKKSSFDAYTKRIVVVEQEIAKVETELVRNVVTGTAAVNGSAGRTSCEYVQLWKGGPKWATFNVGATITDYANLTVGADPTSFYNYKGKARYYNTANVGGLYAWNNPNENGRKTMWDISVATGISDVATTLWGSNWKTPTISQLDTLKNSDYGKTTWTWCDGSTTQYIKGCKLKGYKVSGVGDYASYSIFLPAAGYFDEMVYKASYGGHYWSSSAEDYSKFACGLEFYLNDRYFFGCPIWEGRSVRAVLAR